MKNSERFLFDYVVTIVTRIAMNLKKLVSILGVVGAFSSSTTAYVYEYKKLYRESTHTTIDLLYDIHVSVPHMSLEEFLKQTPKQAMKKLYPTEQKFLETLYTWEASGSRCDLVWETASCPEDPWNPVNPRFIVLHSFFKIWDMKYVRFIAADRNRKCGFNSLFPIASQGTLVYNSNGTGCSFDNPAPLSPKTVKNILKASGEATWRRYKKFYTNAIKKLKDYFRVPYFNKLTLDDQKDLMENDTFHALCDLEILSHVLASKAPKVAVYAGGWHCDNISKFLESDGFKVVYHQENVGCKELPVAALKPLGEDKLTCPL